LLEIPDRFEAGTPDVAGAVGLASALDYLSNVGMENVRDHEIALNTYALQQLSKINDLYVLGPIEPEARTGLVSFVIKDLHPHDIAAILNSEGVAVRSGMHCAMNLHKSLNINTSTRASYYIYNDTSDIDVLIEAVKKAISILK
jgi:cysteine desulfurase/selenocysteine lyase